MQAGPDAQESPEWSENPPPGIFATLRLRDLRLFLFGSFVSNMGTWVQNAALSWLVLEITGKAFWVGMVTAAQFLPMLLLGLPGGVAADRFERRKVMLLTQFVMLACAAALTAVTLARETSLWAIMPPVVVGGAAMAFNAPAFQAFVVDLVPRRFSPTAIAISSSQFSIARIVGPAVAGVVLAAFHEPRSAVPHLTGATLAFGVNAISYIAVIVALLMIRIPPHERASKIGRASFTAVFETVKETPMMKPLLGVATMISLLGAPAVALLPVIARVVLERGAQSYGQLYSAYGLGMASGSLLSARFTRELGFKKMVVGGPLCQAVMMGVLALSGSLALDMIALVTTGFIQGVLFTATQSRLQLVTPDRRRGRVLSLFLMAFAGLYPIGSMIAGVVSDGIGPGPTLGITGLALVAASLLFYRLSRDDTKMTMAIRATRQPS